jgi:hypothetical protein
MRQQKTQFPLAMVLSILVAFLGVFLDPGRADAQPVPSPSPEPVAAPGSPQDPPNFDPQGVKVKTLPGATSVTEEGPASPEYLLQRRTFVHTPAFATLLAGSATLLAGGILGGVALSRASAFHTELAAGADMDELMSTRTSARGTAFACDLLLGTTAALGLATLVLRFGTVSSAPPTPDAEPAYQTPGTVR